MNANGNMQKYLEELQLPEWTMADQLVAAMADRFDRQFETGRWEPLADDELMSIDTEVLS
jgi:hypothetical protein